MLAPRKLGVLTPFLVALVVVPPPTTPAAHARTGASVGRSRPDDRPQTGTQATMQQLFRELTVVFRLSLDDDEFQDPANRQQILEALYALAGNAEQMGAHGESADPTHGLFSRSLVRDANEAVMRFRQGQFEGSRFLVDQLVDNCFACHSQLPAVRSFGPGGQFLDEIAVETLTAEDRARLQIATRQFGSALETYEQMFASPAVSAGRLAVTGAFENYLRICVCVEVDCQRAIATFERLRRRPDVPPYLEGRLERWTKDLELIQKNERAAERDPLAAGRQLIRDAQYRSAFPTDPLGTVRFVAASGWLHRYLATAPTDESRRAEAYYLLGVAESYISPSYWQSQTDVLLEHAIRTAPRTVFARMAYNFLEEYTISGYTGSAGVNIPQDVQDRLDELRSLVEAETSQ